MGWNGLERNKMDYMLTDLLPVELSELFSFHPFYNYLLDKKHEELSEMSEQLQLLKASGKKVFYQEWATTPLKYGILKDFDTTRTMSVMQPLSALNVMMFLECYQKDILSYFGKKKSFSLRYHVKSTNLYYEKRTKKTIKYFQRQSMKIGKSVVQQAGNYFKLQPFESINTFVGSQTWRTCNFEYKYYAKIDYKSCFDSIYSHVYKWIIARNIVDSKKLADSTSSLFISIDRIIQNINGSSSNGLIVGPEFSRMIAEILLQQIDAEVLLSLSSEKLVKNVDYVIYRYVDDIFVFANNQLVVDNIIGSFRAVGEKYLLSLNELKLTKGETPYLRKRWFEKAVYFSNVIEGFFHSEAEYKKLQDSEEHYIRPEWINFDRHKDEITIAMKKFSEDRKTMVSWLLSTLLNKLNKIKDGYILFGEKKKKVAIVLLDFIMFIYAFWPSFEHTRKVISIIVYMDDEIGFQKSDEMLSKLKRIISHYSFIFKEGNIHDLCDWFPFLREFKIALDVKTEDEMVAKAEVSNNPIILANLLIYSSYNSSFFDTTKSRVNNILSEQISKITEQKEMQNEEFWFVIIFHNCPYVTPSLRASMDEIIMNIYNNATGGMPSAIGTRIVCEFLRQKLPSGDKPTVSFFNWETTKGVGSRITYRTYQRTIFKRYKKGKYSIFTSVE